MTRFAHPSDSTEFHSHHESLLAMTINIKMPHVKPCRVACHLVGEVMLILFFVVDIIPTTTQISVHTGTCIPFAHQENSKLQFTVPSSAYEVHTVLPQVLDSLYAVRERKVPDNTELTIKLTADLHNS